MLNATKNLLCGLIELCFQQLRHRLSYQILRCVQHDRLLLHSKTRIVITASRFNRLRATLISRSDHIRWHL